MKQNSLRSVLSVCLFWLCYVSISNCDTEISSFSGYRQLLQGSASGNTPDLFGAAVAFDPFSYGRQIAIGAPGEGVCYIYEGGDESPSMTFKVEAPGDATNFGSALAIYGDMLFILGRTANGSKWAIYPYLQNLTGDWIYYGNTSALQTFSCASIPSISFYSSFGAATCGEKLFTFEASWDNLKWTIDVAGASDVNDSSLGDQIRVSQNNHSVDYVVGSTDNQLMFFDKNAANPVSKVVSISSMPSLTVDIYEEVIGALSSTERAIKYYNWDEPSSSLSPIANAEFDGTSVFIGCDPQLLAISYAYALVGCSDASNYSKLWILDTSTQPFTEYQVAGYSGPLIDSTSPQGSVLTFAIYNLSMVVGFVQPTVSKSKVWYCALTPCQGYDCPCTSNLKSVSGGAKCDNGTWTIPSLDPNVNIVIAQSDRVIIQGPLDLNPSTSLEVYLGANGEGQLLIEGAARLGGVLKLAITSPLPSSQNRSIISADSIEGEFKSIEITHKYQVSKCYKVSGTPNYGSTVFGVLLTQSNACTTNKGRTIGIAVAASLAGVIVIIIILVVVLICLKQRGKLLCLWWSKPDGQLRDAL